MLDKDYNFENFMDPPERSRNRSRDRSGRAGREPDYVEERAETTVPEKPKRRSRPLDRLEGFDYGYMEKSDSGVKDDYDDYDDSYEDEKEKKGSFFAKKNQNKILIILIIALFVILMIIIIAVASSRSKTDIAPTVNTVVTQTQAPTAVTVSPTRQPATGSTLATVAQEQTIAQQDNQNQDNNNGDNYNDNNNGDDGMPDSPDQGDGGDNQGGNEEYVPDVEPLEDDGNN